MFKQKGKNATCSMTNSQHIPSVEEIEPGTILLNNFNGTIEINNNIQFLKGTYIIKFINATVTVNKQRYTADQISSIHALPPLLHPSSEGTEIEEILSLELMKELHLNNTKINNRIQAEKELHQWTNYSLFLIIILSLMLIKWLKSTKNNTTGITIIPAPTIETSSQDSSHSKSPHYQSSIFNLPHV